MEEKPDPVKTVFDLWADLSNEQRASFKNFAEGYEAGLNRRPNRSKAAGRTRASNGAGGRKRNALGHGLEATKQPQQEKAAASE